MCIEAMMQDRKALQSGTSHFLGQNFAKAQNIQYLSDAGEQEYVWTTSWGVSTRLIGGVIMTHGDDDGIILPPRVAPQQVVINPVLRGDENDEKVLARCDEIATELNGLNSMGEKVRAFVDKQDDKGRGGNKFWKHVKRGVPVIVEVGPRDLEEDKLVWRRRDDLAAGKNFAQRSDFVAQLPDMLAEIQQGLFDRARTFMDEHTKEVHSVEEFKAFFENDGGFAVCYAADTDEYEEILEPYKVTPRVIPESDTSTGTCIFTGREGVRKIVFGKSY
jgi:prolyl-tRNA synthetase